MRQKHNPQNKQLRVVDSAHLLNFGSIYMVENMLGSIDVLMYCW